MGLAVKGMKEVKITVVGDAGVGKTALLHRIIKREFTDNLDLKQVHDAMFTNITIPSRKKIMPILHFGPESRGIVTPLSLWDTNSHEDYDHLRPLSYLNTDVYFICCDISDVKSFENANEKWIREILSHWPCPDFVPYCPSVFYVGTKSDMRVDQSFRDKLNQEGKNLVTREEAISLLNLSGRKTDMFNECSAVTGNGVVEVLLQAASNVYQKRRDAGKRNRCVMC